MDILTAIRNATGPRPALFVPEVCIEGIQVSSFVGVVLYLVPVFVLVYSTNNMYISIGYRYRLSCS